jgi:hypothetical protein
MSQQINLLNPALIRQKDLLNTTNIAIVLGLVCMLMVGYYSYVQKQLSTQTTQRSHMANELSATQAQLKQTALLHTPRELNKALLNQITQLEQKEKMQQQVLQTVNQSSTTPDKGYAALMHAFAKQSLNGLWLTGFSIDSITEQLNISGRTLQADLVPDYISRLGNEPALKGKLFSSLNMISPKLDASSVSSASLPSSQLAAATTVLDKNSKSGAPAGTVTQTPVEAQYIEFTLQSIENKSTTGFPSDSSVTQKGSKS